MKFEITEFRLFSIIKVWSGLIQPLMSFTGGDKCQIYCEHFFWSFCMSHIVKFSYQTHWYEHFLMKHICCKQYNNNNHDYDHDWRKGIIKFHTKIIFNLRIKYPNIRSPVQSNLANMLLILPKMLYWASDFVSSCLVQFSPVWQLCSSLKSPKILSQYFILVDPISIWSRSGGDRSGRGVDPWWGSVNDISTFH